MEIFSGIIESVVFVQAIGFYVLESIFFESVRGIVRIDGVKTCDLKIEILDRFNFRKLTGHPRGIDFDKGMVAIIFENVLLEVRVGLETVDGLDVNTAVLRIPFPRVEKIFEMEPCLVKNGILLVRDNCSGVVRDIEMEEENECCDDQA